MIDQKYKWDTPCEWLEETAASRDADWLFHTLVAVARLVDSDTLQDLFEKEMDADGYFDKAIDELEG